MQQSTANSYLFGGNAPYVEELYESYLDNPGSVPDNWRKYFDAMQHVPAVDGSSKPDVGHASVIASFAERAKAGPIRVVTASADVEMGRKRVAVTQLVAAYRFLGSHWANLDPLQRQSRKVTGDGSLRAPMPGRVVAIDVAVGQTVTAGQRLIVTEAMKMEHPLCAPCDGTLSEWLCQVGEQVAQGQELLRVTPHPPA